jgi:hypothetical protein
MAMALMKKAIGVMWRNERQAIMANVAWRRKWRNNGGINEISICYTWGANTFYCRVFLTISMAKWRMKAWHISAWRRQAWREK